MFSTQINALLLVELFSRVISRPLLSGEVVYTILAHSAGGGDNRREDTLRQPVSVTGSRLSEVDEKVVDGSFSEVLEERNAVRELPHTSVKSEFLTVVPISRELPSRVVATIDRGNHEMSGVYNPSITGEVGAVAATDTSEVNAVLSDDVTLESAITTTPVGGVKSNDGFPDTSATMVEAVSEFRDSVAVNANSNLEVGGVGCTMDTEILNSGSSPSPSPSNLLLQDLNNLQLTSTKNPSPTTSAIVNADIQVERPDNMRHAAPPLEMESVPASEVLDLPLHSGNSYPVNDSDLSSPKKSVSEILEEFKDPFIEAHDQKAEAVQDEPTQTDPELVPEGLKVSEPKDASTGRITDSLEKTAQHSEQKSLDKSDPFKSDGETIVVEDEKQLSIGEEINKESIKDLIKSKTVAEDVEESDRIPNKHPSESSKLHPQVISESGVTKCDLRESSTVASTGSTTQKSLPKNQRETIDNASNSDNTEFSETSEVEEEETDVISPNKIWSFWDKLIAGIKCSQRDCGEALHTVTRARKPLLEPSIIRRARTHSNDQ